MIYLHLLLGIILGKITGHYLPFILGCALMDIDHIYSYFKSGVLTLKNLSWKRIVYVVKNEDRTRAPGRTPLIHSVLGMIIFSAIYYLIRGEEVWFFIAGYASHLFLDIPDRDFTPILYPLKYGFQGHLAVWSKTERILTYSAIIIIIFLFIFY